METTRFEKLVPRITEVQSELQSIRFALNEAIREAKAAAEPAVPVAPPQAQTPAPVFVRPIPEQQPHVEHFAERREMQDFESVFAGKWLNIGGLLLIFLGTAFFLKVAFDHNWIGPAMRVSLGIFGGAAIIAYAQMLAAKGQRYFAEGLTALGAGIEFLALYASNAMFHLAPPVVVLAGMVAVNAVLAAIAWRSKSERMALLAAAGGFFAPLLAGTDSQWMLVAYLAMLASGLLLLNEILRSRWVAPAALAGTFAYGLFELAAAPGVTAVAHAAMYATLYLPFFAWGWAATRLRGAFNDSVFATSASALIAAIIAFDGALNPGHRIVLAGVLLALTAMHLAAATVLKSRAFSWLAAAALTCVVPAAFDRAMLNAGWAIEAVLLAIASAQRRDPILQICAVVLLGVDVCADAYLYVPYVSENPLWNERFISLAATATAMILVARTAFADAITESELLIVNALRTTSHLIALLAIGAEGWGIVQHFGGSEQLASAIVSVVGAAFAVVLTGSGLVKRDSLLRWEGLGLLVLTAGKVLFFDMAALDIAYRVISAILVGVALTGISYAYQRREQSNGAGA